MPPFSEPLLGVGAEEKRTEGGQGAWVWVGGMVGGRRQGQARVGAGSLHRTRVQVDKRLHPSCAASDLVEAPAYPPGN